MLVRWYEILANDQRRAAKSRLAQRDSHKWFLHQEFSCLYLLITL